MTYQKISGTLSANAHGSYSTQDALGDLLVTDVLHRKRTSESASNLRENGNAELYARSASRNFAGGYEPMDNNSEYVVRRLTPLDCERLQGYPDNFTNIPGASDTARYKALGNSIALPQWQIIIDNMAKYLPEKATHGSFFTGIGGFDLCWERTHGVGTSRFSSEIEPFPIKVCEYHFGNEEKGITGDIEKYLQRPTFGSEVHDDN